ncbi:MAG: AAA family ATPase [Chlorobi bacterium]|nr:AAA family ATPase [Chlorobiota bacterium]
MKIQEIHIEDYKIFKDFKIDFADNGEPLDIIVVAGINGSGKSSLLEFIAIPYFSLKGKNKIVRKGFSPIHKENIQTETRANPLNEGQIIVNSETYDRKEFTSRDKTIFLKPCENNTNSSTKAIIQYIDKLIYEKDKKSSEVYEIVREKLNNIFLDFDLQVEFNLLDKDRNIFFKNKKSERIPISQLSGGEKELITKAFTLYVSDIKNKIILIDEPESSLHPNWQNRILKIYEDFAKENNNQIIIATHSPHIIASAKKESLRLLVKKGDRIEVISDFDGSYGYEVQKVLLEIMNLESLRIPGIDKKIDTLYELVHNNEYNTDKFKKLMNELESLLGKNDKDLMLMRLEIAKRKKMDEKNK